MSIQPVNIVILAAGRGTRMCSDQPKVLQTVAGKSMLAHVLDTARSLQPTKICVVYGHGGEQVPNTVSASDVTWVYQAQQLGTGHAVQQAMSQLGEEGVTLILYGDVPLVSADTLRRLIALAQPGLTVGTQPGQLALLTVHLSDPAGYGRVVRNAQNEIACIVEDRDADEHVRQISEVNTGMMVVPTRPLAQWLPRINADNQQSEYYLTDVIALAVADGISIASMQPDQMQEVLGINDRMQQAEVERAMQQRIAQQLMRQGVMLWDPARIDVRGSLQCGRDVSIDVGCIFNGAVELGDRVVIGPYCVLTDVKVGRDTHIAAYSHVHGAQTGAHNRIGPFARIRPGSVLADGAHIGNFVEIKNSSVGENSKINHLSYVGDSEVGKHVNIGAGTITCNYDGANKHRTVIGDHVFIGSGTELVAPVEVGDGATIGAGSTITKPAPPGELTLARAHQLTKFGWKRPVK